MQNRVVLLVILLGCISFNVLGTNYYVATTGSDSNNGTAIGTPFLTLAKAVSKATAAGDTIFVRSGTYVTGSTVKITADGTAAKHIVLTAYRPDLINANSRPVFDFSGMSVTSGNIGISLSGVSYWDIYGIIIKGAGDNGMLLQTVCHHVKIEFCGFTRNRDTGLQIRSGSHHCLILNCDSYENADLGAGTSSNGGNADGFAPKLDIGDSVIFRGCRAWMNSDDGWDGYLKSTTTYPDGKTTILEDCWAFKNGYYWLDGSTTSSMNGNGIKMGGSDAKDEAHNFVVVRCIAFRNKGKGFDQNNNAGSMYLYNNTAHSNGDLDFGLKSTGVTYATGAVLVLYNNVSLGSKGVGIRTAGTPPTSTPVTNVTNGFVTGTTSSNFLSLDSTGATAMRNLDGSLPTINYMRLAAASSYIDGGTLLPNVQYHDSLGVTFYGTKPDLGAFETAKITSYTFSGNGNWSAQSKWADNNIPPATMFNGSSILIDPVTGGQCLLDKPYRVAPGCTITVNTNKKFIIPTYLTITN